MKEIKNNIQKEIDTIIKEDKSEKISIDLNDDMDNMLTNLLLVKLKSIVNSESIALFARGIKETPENYVKLAGESLVNHILTEIIIEKVNEEKSQQN